MLRFVLLNTIDENLVHALKKYFRFNSICFQEIYKSLLIHTRTDLQSVLLPTTSDFIHSLNITSLLTDLLQVLQ